ncbi:MAG: DNA gyrase C-terminal beta-propeller domain-containing protein [Lachnospiraceae bacterium]
MRDIAEAVFEEAPITEIPVVFTMNRFGYVKTIETSIYEKNIEMVNQENKIVLPCKNTSKICIFTDKGMMHQMKGTDLPLCKPKDKGIPIENISNYKSSEEDIMYMVPFEELEGIELLFVTRNGSIKRVPGKEFATIKKTVVSTKIAEGDALLCIRPAIKEHIVLLSEQKKYLHFMLSEISLLKKASIGVRGMKLDETDFLKEVYLFAEGEKFNTKIGNKKYELSSLKLKKRDAKPETL